MRWNVIRIVAALTTAISAWFLVGLSLRGGPGPRLDARAHETSGALMAQEALARLAPGGLITVIARDTATFKNPATDIQLASFRKTIGRAHAVIGSLHALQVDPLRPIAVPSGEFCAAIRNAPEGSVIVSFMGLPRLTPADRSRLGENKPAIIAFCPGSLPDVSELRALFKEGLLKAAVVDRRGAQPPASGGANQPESGEKSFVTLTASNLDEAAAWRETDRQ